jgi:hypothetical protein
VEIDEPRSGEVRGVVLAAALFVIGQVEPHVADDEFGLVDPFGELGDGHQCHGSTVVAIDPPLLADSYGRGMATDTTGVYEAILGLRRGGHAVILMTYRGDW